MVVAPWTQQSVFFGESMRGKRFADTFQSPDSWEGSTKGSTAQTVPISGGAEDGGGVCSCVTAADQGNRKQARRKVRMVIRCKTESLPFHFLWTFGFFCRLRPWTTRSERSQAKIDNGCFHVLFAHDTWILSVKETELRILYRTKSKPKPKKGAMYWYGRSFSSWLIPQGSRIPDVRNRPMDLCTYSSMAAHRFGKRNRWSIQRKGKGRRAAGQFKERSCYGSAFGTVHSQ